MNSFSRKLIVVGIAAAFCMSGAVTPAPAGVHTWQAWQVFSNADGTVQFVSIKEAFGGATETGTGSYFVTALPSGSSFDMPNVSGNTANRYYLLGTAAFAALPGAPPLDGVIAGNFVTLATDTELKFTYPPSPGATWTAGTIPSNGIDMLTRTTAGGATVPAPNVATNYAGVTGCVDASGAAPVVLPGVPDGTTGTAMTVGKAGSDLTITFDTSLCTDTNDHQILYGQRNGFPARAGGLYTLTGAVCSIGATSPYTWTGVPTAGDGSGLTWFLVVTTDGAGTEGPWGTWNGVNERNGTGPRCSSNLCARTTKSAFGTTCGH